MQTQYEEPQTDDSSIEVEDIPLVAVMEADEVAAASSRDEWTGARCEKCQAALKSDVVAICRSCGWYASLGRFVEVDPDWEINDDTEQAGAQAASPSHLKVWLGLLPRWSWVIIGSTLAVVVESVAVRVATPPGALRTAWSLGQLGAGILAFIGCHIFNFIVLAAEDADYGVMDLFIKPLKLWIGAARNLPRRLWVSTTAASAITAAVMSVLVIGGIPYERFWDWGFDAPVKQELMGAVMDRVKELESQNSDSLEDAIGDFAGTADELTETPEPAKPRAKADCVILGYQVDRDGRLEGLVLGTTHVGQLVYAGRVAPEMSEEERGQLLHRLSSIKTAQPLIPIESDSAIWVKPKYTCRVSYSQREKGRLREVQWDRMLGTMDTK